MVCYTYNTNGSAGHTTLAELAVVRRGGVPMAAARPVMVKINISLGNQQETKPCKYYYKGVGPSETVREAGLEWPRPNRVGQAAGTATLAELVCRPPAGHNLQPEELVHPYPLFKSKNPCFIPVHLGKGCGCGVRRCGGALSSSALRPSNPLGQAARPTRWVRHTTLAELAVVRRGGVPMAAARRVE